MSSRSPHDATTVAFLGPRGTFTEQALQDFITAGALPGEVRDLPVESPRVAVDMVREGTADFACVALESSVDGPVTQTEDALVGGSAVQIFHETLVPVAFTIMVRPGMELADVRTISSHPVAHAQIREWLSTHAPGADFVPAASNGAAAAAVAAGEVDAAAAPARAAELHDLEVLADGVADMAGAFTRFVLVGKPTVPTARTGHDRTSLVLVLHNRPASLQEALMELAVRNVDMSRISSRPLRQHRGSGAVGEHSVMGIYSFHLDIVGHIDDPAVGEALAALHRRAETVRYLGSWPLADKDLAMHEGSAPPPIQDSVDWVAGLKEGRQE